MTLDGRPADATSAEPWTWADQLSSYRFWGLAAAATCSYLAVRCWSTVGALWMRDELGLPMSVVGVMYGLAVPAGCLALYLGWAVSRSKPVGALITAGLLQLVGALLLAFTSSPWSLFPGMLLFRTGQLGLLFGTPVALAGARSGAKHFVVAYGTVWLLQLYCDGAIAPLVALGQGPWGFRFAVLTMAVLAFAAVVLLLPVRGGLFSESPRPRDRALDPIRREPFIVALLTFVPFYLFYWLYRAHGEASRLAPSRGLLTPRAAVSVTVLFTIPPAVLAAFAASPWGKEAQPLLVAMGVMAAIPFIVPALLATLMDELNAGAAVRGVRRLGSPAASFLWGVLFPPVALALVQSALNRLGAHALAAPEQGR
jgi:hypothetical protein